VNGECVPNIMPPRNDPPLVITVVILILAVGVAVLPHGFDLARAVAEVTAAALLAAEAARRLVDLFIPRGRLA
jgi:hypothetical protein